MIYIVYGGFLYGKIYITERFIPWKGSTRSPENIQGKERAGSVCWDCYERCGSDAGVWAGLDCSHGWWFSDWCGKSNVDQVWVSGYYFWGYVQGIRHPGTAQQSTFLCDFFNFRNCNRSYCVFHHYRLWEGNQVSDCRFWDHTGCCDCWSGSGRDHAAETGGTHWNGCNDTCDRGICFHRKLRFYRSACAACD